MWSPFIIGTKETFPSVFIITLAGSRCVVLVFFEIIIEFYLLVVDIFL